MIDFPGIKASAHFCGPRVNPDARPLSASRGNTGTTIEQLAPEAEEEAATRVPQ